MTKPFNIMVGIIATAHLALYAHAAGAAQTLTIPLNENINQGNFVTGQVNLEPYLKIGGKQYDATDVTVSLTANSDPEYTITSTNNPYYQYASIRRQNFQHQYVTDYYYTRYNSILETDNTIDKLSLLASTDSTTAQDLYNDTIGPYFETGYTVVGSYATGQSYYISNTNIISSGNYDSINANMLLSPSADANLNGTHVLDYAVYDTSGSLQAGLLTISFDKASAAPEPEIWAILLSGFGVVGAALRRKRSAEPRNPSSPALR